MTAVNEQFQAYAEFQREAFEPLRAFTTVAARTFERLARQNYVVLGDYVEYAVDQARLPVEAADLNDYVGRQIARTRAFGEKLAQRTQEYAEIARSHAASAAAAGERRAEKKAA